MSKRDNLFLLQDMLEAAQKIISYTEGLDFESFADDNKTVDAVIRNFEIIGEAANRLDPDFRMEQNQVDWKQIRGFRNRLVHDYFGVDMEIVWAIVENDVEELQFQLNRIIASL